MDNRLFELRQMANVQIFTESELDADAVQELGIPNVFVATGARWRTDGVGRSARKPFAAPDGLAVLSPDAIMAGQIPAAGPVVIYDDERIYLAGVLAEKLADAGYDVIFATPSGTVSPWTDLTLEQHRVQAGLIRRGVDIRANQRLSEVRSEACELACVYSDQRTTIECQTLVLVTERVRNTELFDTLLARNENRNAFRHLELIGDAAAPGLIVDATYSGHMAARNFEADPAEIEADLFRREIPSLA